MDQGAIKSKIEESASGLKESAKHIGEQAKEAISHTTEHQKDMFGRKLQAVTQAVRKASESLRESNEPQLASYVEKLADKADSYTGRIRSFETSDLYSKIGRGVQKNPLIVFSALALTGLVFARFAKPMFSEARKEAPFTGGTGSSGGGDFGSGPYGERQQEPTSDEMEPGSQRKVI